MLYPSPFGPIYLKSFQGSIIFCNWMSPDCLGKLLKIELIAGNQQTSSEDAGVLNEAIDQLTQYFSGVRKEFDLPLTLIGTEFQKKVWQLLPSVAYGSTISYKELSQRFGNPKAVRAIARACGANPLAIILPCHRIVASGGKVGGYTGGIDKKLALLSLEQSFLPEDDLTLFSHSKNNN